MKYNIEKLNKFSLEQLYKYTNLFEKNVVTPYFINHVGEEFINILRLNHISEITIDNIYNDYKNKNGLYGWGLGKSGHVELTKDTLTLGTLRGYNINDMSSKQIQNFMKTYGLGIDCSGLVYNILNNTFGYLGLQVEFNNSLFWLDPSKKVNSRANVSIFGGKASVEVADKIRPLDLLIKSDKSHIILILEIKNELYNVESSMALGEVGITKFTKIPKDYELRRLKIL